MEKMTRMIEGEKINTYVAEIESINTLEVEAGTNGFKGGDAGNGSRTYFRIQDIEGSCMTVNLIKEDERKYAPAIGVELILGGDCELETFVCALKNAVNILETQAYYNKETDEEGNPIPISFEERS